MFSKYEYVYALYRERSFTKAAQKLFISQPSLSVAIKNIEKQVGAPLFDRTSGNVTPTQIGKEYILAAEKIMSVEDDFKNRINDIYSLDTGEISVGGTNYLCSYVLPQVINRFSSLYPKIKVMLTEANSHTLSNLLYEEQLDVVIDSFCSVPEGFEGEELAKEKILLCLPSDRELNNSLSPFAFRPSDIHDGLLNAADTPTIPIKAFENEGFVLLKNGNDMYERAKDIFERGGIAPQIKFSVDQLNISYALADSGMGACFVTDTLLKYLKPSENILLYNVDKDCYRTLYIANKKSKYRTTAMSEFIRIAKEIIGK